MGINAYIRAERSGELDMAESMPPVLESAINTLVAIAETIPLPPGDRVINQQEAAALLHHIADLDKDAARYRWVRTHQYNGVICYDDYCQPRSPVAIQFDRSIDRNITEDAASLSRRESDV